MSDKESKAEVYRLNLGKAIKSGKPILTTQQKVFLEVFAEKYKKELDWNKATQYAYSLTYNNKVKSPYIAVYHLLNRNTFMRWAMEEVMESVFDEIGFSEEKASRRLTDLIEQDKDLKVTLAALRTFWELKGKLGPRQKMGKELNEGDYINFAEILSKARSGLPGTGSPTLGQNLPVPGLQGSISELPQGDIELDERSAEEESWDNSTERLLEEHSEDR